MKGHFKNRSEVTPNMYDDFITLLDNAVTSYQFLKCLITSPKILVSSKGILKTGREWPKKACVFVIRVCRVLCCLPKTFKNSHMFYTTHVHNFTEPWNKLNCCDVLLADLRRRSTSTFREYQSMPCLIFVLKSSNLHQVYIFTTFPLIHFPLSQ